MRKLLFAIIFFLAGDPVDAHTMIFINNVKASQPAASPDHRAQQSWHEVRGIENICRPLR